jgi:hypothetical protein
MTRDLELLYCDFLCDGGKAKQEGNYIYVKLATEPQYLITYKIKPQIVCANLI